jgi:hypothetical protein
MRRRYRGRKPRLTMSPIVCSDGVVKGSISRQLLYILTTSIVRGSNIR